MTLRAVIQGLLRGSDDAEAMLANDGYGDMPAEIFGQALSSYADTATMDEADALSPVLTSMDAGDASDVFAMLEEQPISFDAAAGPSALGASVLGLDALDTLDNSSLDEIDEIDGFGSSTPIDDRTTSLDDEPFTVDDPQAGADDDSFDTEDLFDVADVADSAGDYVEREEFFDTEPEATGEDPSDLDF